MAKFLYFAIVLIFALGAKSEDDVSEDDVASSDLADFDSEEVDNLDPLSSSLSLNLSPNKKYKIMTQNFPLRMPAGQDIKLKLNLIAGTQFKMVCKKFSMPCSQNFLSVQVASGRENKFCSRSSSFTSLKLIGNFCPANNVQITLRIKSANKKRNVGRGLKCKIIGVPCGSDTTTTTSTSSTSTTSSSTSSSSTSSTSTTTTSTSSTTSTSTTTVPPTCGKVSKSKIINGNETDITNFPWAVWLYIYKRYNETTTGASLCGGSIISNDIILTAAHCVKMDGATIESIRVNAGCSSLYSCEQQIYAEKWVYHESYNYPAVSITYGDDIGIIKLSESLTYSDSIQPVCLPSTNVSTANYSLVTVGWGLTEEGAISNVLKEANMLSQPDDICYANNVNILCAIEDSGYTCNGDSGGFIGNIRNYVYEIDGITSYGRTGCPSDSYSGFTEVYPYLDWISEKIASF